jgi:ribonucleoside-diphosphate reductase alpha chain
MTKIHMPPVRDSVTRKFKIGGYKVYATVGLKPDGRPGEIFLVAKQTGSLERGLFHALAVVISMGLQRGVPLEDVVQKFKGMHFEPAGVTGDPDFPMVASFLDYLARWIEKRWNLKCEDSASSETK